MRAYELMVIFDSGLDDLAIDDQVKSVAAQVATRGAAVAKTDRWGRRRFAYEIDHKGEGAYHLLTFAAEPTTLEEISRVLKITDGVMRHLAVRRVQGGTTRPPEPMPEEPVAVAATARQDGAPEESAAESAGEETE